MENEKITKLKIEMLSSPIFSYENHITPFELWKSIMNRIEELENEEIVY